MDEADIFHPLARVVHKKCCKLPNAFRESCQAIYHEGSVYVKSAHGRDMGAKRVYDYSISDDVWNISPIKCQDSFKALAVRNDQIVLIGTCKEQGKEFIRIYPLTSDRNSDNTITLPVKANKPASGGKTFLSAASDKNTLVIAYSNLKVFCNQSEPIELALPRFDEDCDHIYLCLLYNDCLYLSPKPTSSSYVIKCQWYYTQLPQHNEQIEHDKAPLPVDDDLLPPQHKKARLDQESAIKWEHMPLLPHSCSNLAYFGKRLVTMHSGSWRNRIEIQAYSPLTNSWVIVAGTNEDLDHTLGEHSSIVGLDDTGELMVIECGNNHRDVYKLSIEVKSYDPESEVTLQALHKLEAGADIPVLIQLESKLREFQKCANIAELCAYRYDSDCPVVEIYINSWLEGSKSGCTTWKMFLEILKDIGLQDVADKIHDYLSSTVPYPPIAKQEAGQVEHREEGEEGESKSVGMSDSYSTEGGDDQLSTDNNSDSDKSEPVHKKSNNSKSDIDKILESLESLEEKVKNLTDRVEKLENMPPKEYFEYFKSETSFVRMSQQRNQRTSDIKQNLYKPEDVFCIDYPDGEFSRPDERDLLIEIAPTAGKHWFMIGMHLGLKHEELEEIERGHQGDDRRFAELFNRWKQQGDTDKVVSYKWKSILDILEFRVPLRNLAKDIRRKLKLLSSEPCASSRQMLPSNTPLAITHD